jgi:hypothetical protein
VNIFGKRLSEYLVACCRTSTDWDDRGIVSTLGRRMRNPGSNQETGLYGPCRRKSLTWLLRPFR